MKIHKSQLIFFFLIISLCKPMGLGYEGVVKLVFYCFQIIAYGYAVLLVIKNHEYRKNNKALYILTGFELCLLGSTLLMHASVVYWGKNCLDFLSIYIITSYHVRKNPIAAIKTITFTFTLFLIVNYLLRILGFSIIISGITYNFLGLRTRVTDSIMVVLLAASIEKKYGSLKKEVFLLINAVLVISLAEFKVSTGIVGLFLFYMLLIMLKNGIFKRILLSKKTIYILSALIVGIVVYRIQTYLTPLFQLLFNKGADFTNRTYLWDSAIRVITSSKMKMIFGNGVSRLGEWVPFNGGKWQAHNNYLQIILDGGFLALSLMAAHIVYTFKECMSKKRASLNYEGIAAIVTYIIIMITEIYSYYPQFYLVMALINSVNNCDEIRKLEE